MIMQSSQTSSCAIEDAALPTLAVALQPAVAERALIDRLAGVIPANATLRSISVKAHKPGRRCLIEYQLEVPRMDGSAETISLLGKIRANRFGNSGCRQLLALWNAGFDGASADGISVPEPMGTVPALRMWLQRKVPGTPATDRLSRADGDGLAVSIARAVHKLHTADLAADKRHTMDDELAILVRSLSVVTTRRPDLTRRVHRLIDACVRVGGLLPSPRWCGSHRDFYADQVLVSPDRLYLVDFDLFCDADPGLDVGNFIGHVTEFALRAYGDASALSAFERRLENSFVALAGESVRWPVRIYTALTIARHVYLSTRFLERSRLSTAMLGVAEKRLLEAAAEGGHS